MKSLILFDGSRSSQMTLLTACQDAHRQAACTKEGQLPEAHAVLVVAFEDMTALSNAGKGEYSVAAELESSRTTPGMLWRYSKNSGVRSFAVARPK